MRGALHLWAGVLMVVGPPPAAAPQDPGLRAEDRAFVEIVTPAVRFTVQQRIPVQLRFGVESRFLRENLIQPFRVQLDVPVRLEARWLDDLPGAWAVTPDGAARVEKRASIVLNEEAAAATRLEDRVIDGRRFTVLQIEREFLAERAGELVLPAPSLRLTYATRFREDFLGGRVPADRVETAVVGAARALQIEAWPAAGRPPSFTGAVGRFAVSADASPREVVAGDSFKLVLRIEGEGNTQRFAAPQLAELQGFHVFGVIEEKTAALRAITYDLAPLSDGIAEVPSIAFAFLDPGPPAAYRTVWTAPIPLEVRPRPGGVALPVATAERDVQRVVPGKNDIFDIRTPPAGRGDGARHLSSALVWGGLLAPWLLGFGLWSWRRARARGRGDLDGLRARGAAGVLREQLSAGAGASGALAIYLGSRLRCGAAAVIAPELPERLVAAGVPADLAGRTVQLFDRLDGARFGGRDSVAGDELLRCVDELEVAFDAAEAAS